MNYIYDILINLQKKPYDFFEWNESDEIIHVRKIPFFTISSCDLKNLKKRYVKMDQEFLTKISNRCEIFTNKSVRVLKYVCLFSDTKEVLALEFNEKGEKKRSSKLLLDEEIDVLEVSENIDEVTITFENSAKDEDIIFKTRKEIKIYDYILRQFTDENYVKLKYLYFDCFDKEEDDFSKIVHDLLEELNNNWNNVHKKIYNFLRLSSQRK